MLLIGNGRLITRSRTNPYLENGAVVLDGQWWNIDRRLALDVTGPAPTPRCWTASGTA